MRFTEMSDISFNFVKLLAILGIALVFITVDLEINSIHNLIINYWYKVKYLILNQHDDYTWVYSVTWNCWFYYDNFGWYLFVIHFSNHFYFGCEKSGKIQF